MRVITVGIEPQIRQPVQQKIDGRSHLEASEMHTETYVDTVAPRQVALLLTEDVELVGVREPVLLVGRRPEHRHHRRACGNRHPTEHRVFGRHTGDRQQRRFPPHALLDRLRKQRAVGANCLELVRVRQQREEQAAQRAVGRLDTGRQQEPEEREDLLVTEFLPVDLGGGERTDQILTWVGPAGFKDRREVFTQRSRGCKSPFGIHQPAQQRDRPPLELGIVFLGQSEQTGDDLARIVEGELLDQICSAVGRELVDQAVGDATDQLVLPPCQRLLRERFRDEAAKPTVDRLIHAEHHPFAQHRTEGRDDGGRRERLVVAQHLLDVLVAIHDEHRQRFFVRQSTGRFEALHRLFAADPRQLRVRVTDVAGDGVVKRPEVLEVVE